MDGKQPRKDGRGRETLLKLGLIAVGFTLLPGFIYLSGAMPSRSVDTIAAFYGAFYKSLLRTGKDGLVAWCIGFAPYMLFEGYLLVRNRRKGRL